jgi:hypothetical protein
MVVVVALIVMNVMALFLVRRRVERRHEAAGPGPAETGPS